MIGTTLAHFRVTAKLGEGGMGEVYRAEDTKLGREVAIKVLPEAVAEDPERLARFEREAQVLASLNHPHIAAIYSIEAARSEDRALHFLVMELAQGEDLKERLGRGPIPIDDALPIALQITEALEAAHERGIVHRDLKPANIKVDPEGKVKVLDFGLAKAFESSASNGAEPGTSSTASPANLSLSPTLTQQMTQAGVILGTAAYMAPEQAKGRPVDKRADIWAFGVVVWEMLTGRALYGTEETVSEVIAAVLTRDPDLDALPASASPALRRLLARCLTKDPRLRLRDIGEARIALENEIAGAEPFGAAEPAPGKPARRWSALVLAGGLIAGLALGAWIARQLRPAEDRPVVKLEVPTDNLRADRTRIPLISPDGTKVMIPEARGLVIRSLDSMGGVEIPDSAGARYICWSPDGREIAFVDGVEIRRASVEGGMPTPVVKLPSDVGGSGGMVWTGSGQLLVAGGDVTGIMQVPVQGGAYKELVALDRELEVDFHEIALLPNREDLLYIMHRRDPGEEKRVVDTIGAILDGRKEEILRLEGDSIISLAYSPSGHILFHRVTTTPGIWAVPFSLARGEVTGEAFLVAANTWLPSVSADGTLVLVEGLSESPAELVEVDRQGNLLRRIVALQSDGEAPHLSPDQSRLLVTSVDAGNWDIWIYDLLQGTRTRFTFESTFDAWGRWSPSGDEILYSVADMRDIKIKRVDGTGEAIKVGEGLAPDWIPDGSGFVFEHFSNETDSWDISYKRFDEEKAVSLLSSAANESTPKISPDGRYVLYVSDESGRWEVYAQSFPNPGRRWQISTNGGSQPTWSPAGNEIFYVQDATLMSVTVVDPDRFTLGRPERLMAESVQPSGLDSIRLNSFTPGPDGQSLFVVREAKDEQTPNRLMLIQNWAAEFDRAR